MQIFNDFLSAVQCFNELRKAHRSGKETARVIVTPIEPVSKQQWVWTMESGFFPPCARTLELAVRSIYYTFPPDTRTAFTRQTEDGSHVERLNFWREKLRPLPRKEYYRAMQLLARGYADGIRRCKNMPCPPRYPL